MNIPEQAGEDLKRTHSIEDVPMRLARNVGPPGNSTIVPGRVHIKQMKKEGGEDEKGRRME